MRFPWKKICPPSTRKIKIFLSLEIVSWNLNEPIQTNQWKQPWSPIHFPIWFLCVFQSLSHNQLFVTPWAPLSMGFPRQEYWLPFPPPGDLPDRGIEPRSPALAGRFFTTEPPRKPSVYVLGRKKVKSLSCVWLFATPWTVAYQFPPSMGFFWLEYWSGLPFNLLSQTKSLCLVPSPQFIILFYNHV